MLKAVLAGLAYFAIAFAVGFVLGTLRVLVFAPRFGETAMVVAELPLMLAVSWLACKWIIASLRIPSIPRDRVIMGATAFVALMVAEVGVSVLALGRTVQQHLGDYAALSGQLGLAGQVAFALFPFVQRQ